MAIRKITKKRVARSARKIIIVRIGRKVYTAPLSALGRPTSSPALVRAIVALEKKSRKCCHHLQFAGVYPHPTFLSFFGNAHDPD